AIRQEAPEVASFDTNAGAALAATQRSIAEGGNRESTVRKIASAQPFSGTSLGNQTPQVQQGIVEAFSKVNPADLSSGEKFRSSMAGQLEQSGMEPAEAREVAGVFTSSEAPTIYRAMVDATGNRSSYEPRVAAIAFQSGASEQSRQELTSDIGAAARRL